MMASATDRRKIEAKGFNAPNKASRKYEHYAVNHDHAFKFVPAELRQMMAGPGCWAGLPRMPAWVL
jgi:hypothetical protein